MKKLSRKQKLHHLRKSLNEMEKRISENKKRDRGNRERKGYVLLVAPEKLCLLQKRTRKRLISFASSIHRLVSKGKKNVWLDFGPTRKVVADGMIYLHAEISRLLEVVDGVDIKSSPPADKKVGQVFNRVGFSRLVKCNIRRAPECQHKDVAGWFSAAGQGVYAAKCGSILDQYEGRIAPALSRELFKGMSEAMTNSHQHAYIDERGDFFSHAEFYKPWWLFSHEDDGRLSVVLCDLGIGIPKTLPKTKPSWFGRLRSFFGKELTDSKTIEEAVKDSITRTHKDYRGKGLRQIVETINSSSDGEIFILSNKGCYHYKSGEEPDLTDYSTSIRGTIIAWRVAIPDNRENVDEVFSHVGVSRFEQEKASA